MNLLTDCIISLRHELHQNPELSMRECHTIEYIRDFLTNHTSLEVVECDGWLYAVKQGVSDQGAIAFRADMDALPIDERNDLPYQSVNPGVSHKCGHDGHCAALCAFALELDKVRPERSIYLIFQPGEETGEGAKRCVSLLSEKNITEIYAFHNLSGYEEGTVIYRKGLTQPASEGLRLNLIGKASHAAEPENGRNPTGLIARIVLYSQDLCESVTDRLLLSTVVGMHAGNDDFGVAAHEGNISLTLRAENEADMKRLEKCLITFAEEEAREMKISVNHQIHDYFPETRNHDVCINKIISAADNIGAPSFEMTNLFRASEDFGYYLKECHGAMFYIGNGKDYPDLHTAEYDFNDQIIPVAVSMFLELIKG